MKSLCLTFLAFWAMLAGCTKTNATSEEPCRYHSDCSGLCISGRCTSVGGEGSSSTAEVDAAVQSERSDGQEGTSGADSSADEPLGPDCPILGATCDAVCRWVANCVLRSEVFFACESDDRGQVLEVCNRTCADSDDLSDEVCAHTSCTETVELLASSASALNEACLSNSPLDLERRDAGDVSDVDMSTLNLVDAGGAQQVDMSIFNVVDAGVSDRLDAAIDAAVGGCEFGARRCKSTSNVIVEVCDEGGSWVDDFCGPNETCSDGVCLPPSGVCSAGERRCLSNGNIGVCRENGSFRDEGACAPGFSCASGECVSFECANASIERSYVGCDFLTLDLPNSAFDLRDENSDGLPDGTTENSPTGLVVANHSSILPVQLTLYGPNGMSTAVIASRVVQVPSNIDLPANQYQDTTVTSNVRDSSGQIVTAEISRVDNLTVPPGGFATLLLPRSRLDWSSSNVRKTAFRMQSTRPVVAYQFSPYCCNFSFSNDASLLVPVSNLGREYRYLGPAHHQFFDIRSGTMPNEPAVMTIVGAVDNTSITVELPSGQTILPDSSGRVSGDSGRVQLTLDAQEVATLPSTFNEESATDLTGVSVTGSEPFALFSGHVCSFAPSEVFACDHLQEQLHPTTTWGNRYHLAPLLERGNNFPGEVIYWKILAHEDNSVVTFGRPFDQLNSVGASNMTIPHCGDLVLQSNRMTLNAGDYCEFGSKVATQVESTRPISIGGLLVGQSATYEPTMFDTPFGRRAGDPSFFMLPSETHFRSEYVFVTPGTYDSNNITLISRPDNQITLNGAPVNLLGATPIAGGGFVFAHVRLDNDGFHDIVGSQPFGIVVYGYDDFVSYAYPGGQDF